MRESDNAARWWRLEDAFLGLRTDLSLEDIGGLTWAQIMEIKTNPSLEHAHGMIEQIKDNLITMELSMIMEGLF